MKKYELLINFFASQGEFKVTEKEFTMEDVIKASQDNRVWN